MTELIVLLLFVILALFVALSLSVWSYNQLVRSRLLVREAFSGIDVQLKRRHDLIPNLVRTVEAFARHEKNLLTAVARGRAEAIHAVSPAEKQARESVLSGSLGGLLAVAEGYPHLTSDQHYLDLMRQLSKVEDDLQSARRYYNGTVREFNTRVESFPSNVFAGLLGFHIEPFFTLERLSEAQVPQIRALRE